VTTENIKEYDDMMEAEKLFAAALEKEYGLDAVDMRYQPDHKYPENLQKIAADFKTAANKYHNLWTKVV